jgi:hypothetical protein
VIFGVVQATSACPVEPTTHPCGPLRLRNVEVGARSLSGRVEATVRTSADGRYSLRLRPGQEVLIMVMTPGMQRCLQVSLSVRHPTAIRADITCSTGIR